MKLVMKNHHDYIYNTALEYVLDRGERVENRTGTDTISALGLSMRYDLGRGFPVLTAKHVAWKLAIAEMLWFISGKCDSLETLEPSARKIWEPWADERGNLGPIYGSQWRHWNRAANWHDGATKAVDQLGEVVEAIKAGSTSRRLIVSSWQPSEIDEMALPPCHVMFQFTPRAGKLHLQLYQRSCDMPIGGPFNVAQYSALLCMVAKLAGLQPGTFIHSIHDAHIYVDQIDGVQEWLSRETFEAPQLVIHGEQTTIDDFKLSDFELVGYKHAGKIELPVAV